MACRSDTALRRIDELAEDREVDERTARTYRQLYEDRLERVRSRLDEDVDEGGVAGSGARSSMRSGSS